MVVSATGLRGLVTGLRSGRVTRQNMAEKGGREGWCLDRIGNGE